MRSAGIAGRMFDWICDYLSHRSIYMSVADGEISMHNVTRGVPQDGVLSPTVFNISLIGLGRFMPQSVEISMYADYICTWWSGRNRCLLRARLQRAISSIEKFRWSRGLEISPTKYAAIVFTKRDVTKYQLTAAGAPIPYVNYHKFLGVTSTAF